MSTNFYAYHIPSEQEYKEMEIALANRQINTLKKLIYKSEMCYHIGKRSSGWQFLFASHIQSKKEYNDREIVIPWEDKLDSIKEYLSRDDVQIQDECGEVYTCEQFFDEINYCLYHDKNKAINGKDYDEQNSKYYKCEPLEYTTEEGLRFSKRKDFC